MKKLLLGLLALGSISCFANCNESIDSLLSTHKEIIEN